MTIIAPVLHLPSLTADQRDRVLMTRVADGNIQAFDALYTRWNTRVQRYLVRWMGEVSSAEEVLQETWTRVWRYRGNYDAGRSFRSWLYAIAANLCRSRYARSSREDLVETLNDERDERPESYSQRDTLRRLMSSLNEADRQLVMLVAEGFKPAEIAQHQGITGSAVRVRLFRLRKTLRAQYRTA